MKLKKYSKLVQKLAEQHPNLECYYSSDDEGNSFHKVYLGPTVVNFDIESRYPDEESKQKVIIIN